ncbi:MAG: ankyrin repeat domain-containing protein, partial [Bacteroidia bacterium]|nr:ankyrin repeat domain-containing protein [Bacteroidia bacterium]
NINATDAEGATPLHLAAQMEDVEAIKFLLSKGANVNAKDAQGRTPLGRVECVTTQYCQQTKNLLVQAGGR